MTDDEVRTATVTDLDAIVGALTDAFADDPLMRWAFAADVRRQRLAALWRFIAAEGYLPRGTSTVVPVADAAALWLAPGEVLGDEFWQARGEQFASAREGDVERLSAIGEAMSVHHPREQHHWYLLAIGVATTRQGTGLGSALLAHTLAKADEDGAPAYLEATSLRSRVLYERHGFEVTAELVVDDSPPLWPMWRESTRDQRSRRF